jgi:hypothetical protein
MLLLALITSAPLVFPRECSAQEGGGHYLTVEAMNAKLDSLEAAAFSCESSNAQIRRVTMVASWGWKTAGSKPPPPPPPYPGIVARLARIYRQCEAHWLREAIVTDMPIQAERTEAVAFLAEVAREVPGPEEPWAIDAPLPLSYQAIDALRRSGRGGRAVLEQLHRDGTVREASARARLEAIARNGFRGSP